MKFTCWETDDPDCGTYETDNAVDAEDAATDACEHWHEINRWDDMPVVIAVSVRDSTTDVVTVVDVHPSFEINFYGYARCLGSPHCMEHEELSTSHGPSCPKWSGA